jgi:hypothetical protein
MKGPQEQRKTQTHSSTHSSERITVSLSFLLCSRTLSTVSEKGTRSDGSFPDVALRKESLTDKALDEPL